MKIIMNKKITNLLEIKINKVYIDDFKNILQLKQRNNPEFCFDK